MESPAHPPHSPRLPRVLSALACVFLTLILLAYAGLIGLGRWQLDEYADFYHIRSGVPFLLDRLRWSPRPISEPIFYAYGWLVDDLHHSLIVPFLAILWAVFLASGLFTLWQTRRQTRAAGAPSSLLLPLTLMALFLTGSLTTEVFYWPAGAVAYLPTLAATLLLFLQTVEGRLDTSRGRILAMICMIVAAGSSEAGATFVLSWCLILAARRALTALRPRESRCNPALWWIIPAAFSLLLILAVRMNRYKDVEVPSYAASPVLGHPLRALAVGVREFIEEVLGKQMIVRTATAHPHMSTWFHSGPRLPLAMLLGSRLPMEILLAAGVFFCCSRPVSRETAARILELIAAFVLASVFTIAAANLHFGETCCDRHELLRECWIAMSFAGLAIAARARTGAGNIRSSAWAPLLLCAAVLCMGFEAPLLRTWRFYPALRSASDMNFTSGFSHAQQMDFIVLPSVGVITEEFIGPGTYTSLPGEVTGFSSAMYPYYLLGFFGKHTLTVRPLSFAVPPAQLAACACSRVNGKLR